MELLLYSPCFLFIIKKVIKLMNWNLLLIKQKIMLKKYLMLIMKISLKKLKIK